MGNRVVLFDDSIVRGTTMKNLIRMLKKAGAKEVHVRVSSPPFLYPCYFGTDVPAREQLIAYNRTVEDIRQVIGALPLSQTSAMIRSIAKGEAINPIGILILAIYLAVFLTLSFWFIYKRKNL